MNKIISTFLRVFIGVFLIISGLLKVNDTIGFSYKLNEYFQVLNIEFFSPISLQLAFLICIFEVVLGALLITATKFRFTFFCTSAMMIFFTFLTFYSAYFEKVTDCGCFGDALKLRPWDSFYKDVVILIILVIIYKGRDNFKSFFSKKGDYVYISSVVLVSTIFAFYTYNNLPLKDYRPYAVGQNISYNMKTCFELNLPCTEESPIYLVRDIKTGEELEMVADMWLSNTDRYEYLNFTDKTKILVKGYEPKITDFSVQNKNIDITDSVLNLDDVLVFVSYDLNKINEKSITNIKNIYMQSVDEQIIFLTASNEDIIKNFNDNNDLNIDFSYTDETVLKTVVRSNPGILRIQEGTVIEKLHHNHFEKLIK